MPSVANTPLSPVENELDAIRKIFRAINAKSDLRSILNAITSTTSEVLEVDSVSIYLLDQASKRLVLRATTGLFPTAVDHGFLKMGEGLTGWAAAHREVVAIREAQLDARFSEVPNTRERSFASLLAVPLTNQENVVGAMNVQTHELHDWTEGEIEFVSVIGDVVAGVIERAVLQEETERKIRELSAVSEVSKAVIAPVYLDQTLRVVAEMAARATGARRCSLLLLDEDIQAYVPRAVFDERPDVPLEPNWALKNPPVPSEKPIAEPVIVGEARVQLRPEYAKWAEAARLSVLLAVPMVLHDRIIGMMNMWAEAAGGFAGAQVTLAATLANQIALAIENAHLVGNAAIVQEMHHRVKNNLQNVVMLLQMQLSDDRKVNAKEVLHESINRIMSIAAVHDAMAHDGFRRVDVRDVISRVTQLVHANMTRPNLNLEINVDGPSLRLSSRVATALALCVNELVQNAMEHAFVDRRSGTIQVLITDNGESLVVEVRDDGRGSAAGDMSAPSLGLNIVESLITDDLRGSFELTRDTHGSVAIIRAPITAV